MIITLLIVTFIVAFAVASIVVLVFSKPIDGILKRVIADELSYAWARYLKFAIYVVGISGGVRVWSYEAYQTPQLTAERWVLEIYQTIIGTLTSTAMLLLVFFVFALIAVVLVRIFELRKPKAES
jgi:hypothetical protein